MEYFNSVWEEFYRLHWKFPNKLTVPISIHLGKRCCESKVSKHYFKVDWNSQWANTQDSLIFIPNALENGPQTCKLSTNKVIPAGACQLCVFKSNLLLPQLVFQSKQHNVEMRTSDLCWHLPLAHKDIPPKR